MKDDHTLPTEAEAKLRGHYDRLALTGNENVTALDYNLRELEIDFALQHVRDGDRLLDVGCGSGVALRAYAAARRLRRAAGVDFSPNMISLGKLKASEAELPIEFHVGSALALPFAKSEFDVLTSHRCLLALLDWKRQRDALAEYGRVLRPGGIMILLEATTDGLARLNAYRKRFGLDEIGEGGRDGYERLLLEEQRLCEYLAPDFELVRIQRFGMYYLLTRILQPLFAAPEPPRYDHPLNDAARQLCSVIPDFEGLGHLAGFLFRRR